MIGERPNGIKHFFYNTFSQYSALWMAKIFNFGMKFVPFYWKWGYHCQSSWNDGSRTTYIGKSVDIVFEQFHFKAFKYPLISSKLWTLLYSKLVAEQAIISCGWECG